MKNVVIVGATSAMAEEVAKIYATKGANLFLMARDCEKLATIEQDLNVRGAKSVTSTTFNATDLTSHQQLVNDAFAALKQVDVFLIAHGSLPDQQKCEQSAETALEQININGLSVISLLTHVGNKMEQQKSGNITVISSVAGDRGRQSNYVYGTAKAMVSTFLQGLAQRLFKVGVHVLDIKPGFVDTPMTAEFDKGALWAQPQTMGEIIVKRIESKSNFAYAPFFWFGIMIIIKSIPKFVFNRIKL